MGLEAGSFIKDLVITNPDGGDPKSQGDDHLRLIKKVLRQTFPNLNGAVTATPAELNGVSDKGALVPPGVICMWAGTVANVPEGWKLCNGSGTISNGVAVPDLRDRFVVGAGLTYAPRATGGNKDAVVVSHTHVASTSASGTHTHGVPQGHVYVGTNNGPYASGDDYSNTVAYYPQSQPAGDHTHVVNIETVGVSGVNANLPPYYALAYIIKN